MLFKKISDLAIRRFKIIVYLRNINQQLFGKQQTYELSGKIPRFSVKRDKFEFNRKTSIGKISKVKAEGRFFSRL